MSTSLTHQDARCDFANGEDVLHFDVQLNAAGIDKDHYAQGQECDEFLHVNNLNHVHIIQCGFEGVTEIFGKGHGDDGDFCRTKNQDVDPR